MDVVSPVDEPTKLRSASSPNIECGFGDLNCSIIPAEIDGAGQTRSVLEPGIVDELVVALDFGAERKDVWLVTTRSHLQNVIPSLHHSPLAIKN
jgi:hypothetical protein